MLSWLAILLLRPQGTSTNTVRNAGLYWHFVDLVWGVSFSAALFGWSSMTMEASHPTVVTFAKAWLALMLPAGADNLCRALQSR